jgi:hypothetical protein
MKTGPRIVCLVLLAAVSHAELLDNADSKTQAIAEKVRARCRELIPRLFSTNVPFASAYFSSFANYEISSEKKDSVFVIFYFDGYPGYWYVPKGGKRGVLVSVDACISVSYDTKNNLIRSIHNGLLYEYLKPDTVDTNSHTQVWVDKAISHGHIKTNDMDGVPELSIAEAAERAKRYLDVMGIPLATNHVLYSAEFNSGGWSPLCWELVWGPPDHPYKFDDTPISCEVTFHEKLGLVHARPAKPRPYPKTMSVNIAKNQAVFKAEKAAPLVMQTPFYLQCRLPGFKVKGVKSAELLISSPNWLLDPERAIWAREPPTDETRLCWVVVFETVDTVRERPRNFKPMPPDILVYIDAATGEIVGANFT